MTSVKPTTAKGGAQGTSGRLGAWAKLKIAAICAGIALGGLWLLWPGERSENATQASGVARAGAGFAWQGANDAGRGHASAKDERGAGAGSVSHAVDRALGSAFTSDEEYDAALAELSKDRASAIELLRRRYYETNPDHSVTRWTLVSTAASLPCEAALGFLTEVLWSQEDEGSQAVEGRGVVRLEALQGLSDVCARTSCNRQEMLRYVVAEHPDVGIKKAAAGMYVYLGRNQKEASDALRSQLPEALRDLVPSQVVRGAEFTTDLFKKETYK